jgi:hypothetical protein
MPTTTPRIPALLAAGSILCVVATGMASAHPSAPGVFRDAEALSYVLGSKRAVGYFQSVAGKCELTLMIAEVVDPEIAQPPSAARMRFGMMPGQSVALGSAEGEQMTATCGAGGRTLEIRRTSSERT